MPPYNNLPLKGLCTPVRRGDPPTDFECYASALTYAIIYSSRFSSIRSLEPHFRVTFYATTGYYEKHEIKSCRHGSVE
eukprot:5133042-Amphidinium_carterae.2